MALLWCLHRKPKSLSGEKPALETALMVAIEAEKVVVVQSTQSPECTEILIGGERPFLNNDGEGVALLGETEEGPVWASGEKARKLHCSPACRLTFNSPPPTLYSLTYAS